MLDLNEGLRLAKDALSSASAMRAWYDTFWSMQMGYAYGSQWGYVNSRGSTSDLRFLRSVIDPQREDVRVSFNRIHPDVIRTSSALSPKQILFDMEANSISSRVVKFVGEKLLASHLRQIRAIDALRDQNLARCALGSAVVRRTLTTRGQPIQTPQGGQIRSIQPGLALVGCHEIIRDPSAHGLRWDQDEQVFGQEKPQTTQWVKRNFGIEIKTEATLGQLSDYQRQLAASCGASARFMYDSKQPAVVIYEFYFTDPDVPLEQQRATGGWPWVLFAYRDVASDDHGEMKPLGAKAFGQNPFHGNPFSGRHYDRVPNAPWGRGIPSIQQGGQDILNIAMTHYARIMQQSAGKWRYEEGTLTPAEVGRMLSPDLRTPIAWRRAANWNTPPERVPSPQINSAAEALLKQMPTWMRESINLNDVQFGAASKRGESGEALDIRRTEASAPLETIRDEDDAALAEMLLGMTYDLGRNSRLDELQERLGESCSTAQMLEFLREPIDRHIVAVNVHPAVHRPKTPGEVREDYMQLAAQQLMEPDKAFWNMMLSTPPVIVDDGMHRAYQDQMAEIQSMLAGELAEVAMYDEHKYHYWTIKWYCSDPSFKDQPPEVKDAIAKHQAEHMQAMIAESQGFGMAQQPAGRGKPSPPSEAFRQPEPAGAAAPM